MLFHTSIYLPIDIFISIDLPSKLNDLSIFASVLPCKWSCLSLQNC